MSQTLQQGGNTAIQGTDAVYVALSWEPRQQPGLDVDASAFLLQASGKVRSDEDFVFYNQNRSPEGAVQLIEKPALAGGNDAQVFLVNLPLLPAAIEKIAFAVTIHEGKARGQSFASLQRATIRLVNPAGKDELVRFDLPLAGSPETAMIFGEVYRRGAQWKFKAIGQGFAGGLGPLATNFGVDIAEPAAPPAPPAPKAPAPTPAPQPKPAPPAAPPLPPAAAAPVNLQKITLQKKGESVSLKKDAGDYGEVIINLNWSQNGKAGAAKPGLFDRLAGRSGRGGIDLDLGCIFELMDGRAGVVQALGNTFGAFHDPPYIQLSGDDRTGAVAGGEDLRINGAHWKEIKRIVVFAFIYEGVPNWAAADGVVTLKVPGNPPVEVRLDNHDNRFGMCAIAAIDNQQGQMRVTKIAEYVEGHRQLDARFNFGLKWVRGGGKP